jgi:hypothetical protein
VREESLEIRIKIARIRRPKYRSFEKWKSKKNFVCSPVAIAPPLKAGK